MARVRKSNRSDILHSGRLGTFSSSVARYTSSIDVDPQLSRSVVAINCAHLVMLQKNRVLSDTDAAKLLQILSGLKEGFALEHKLEDIHMNLENIIIRRAGKEIGGMLNLGKSRNDQVATALRMAMRERLLELGEAIVKLQKSLIGKAEAHSACIMPGYTHLQRAQPVTLGHHLLAHFASLDRDFMRVIDCYLRLNTSPMGAGALAGTGFLIDREFVAELLGFDAVMGNSLDAVSSRDFATEAIFVCAQAMIDLSRMAEELILWTTKEFAFAEIPDDYASTSSMMPQKKNAIVPEIGRAKTAQVLGDLVASLALVKALPLSYNLDLQELTRNLWSAFEKSIDSLRIHSDMIGKMTFNERNLRAATEDDDFLYATELADHLVKHHALSFREAHNRVGKLVRFAASQGNGKHQLLTMGEEKILEFLGVRLSPTELKGILDPEKVLAARRATGAPNPTLVLRACKASISMVKRHELSLLTLQNKISESQRNLERHIAAIIDAYIRKQGKKEKMSREKQSSGRLVRPRQGGSKRSVRLEYSKEAQRNQRRQSEGILQEVNV